MRKLAFLLTSLLLSVPAFSQETAPAPAPVDNSSKEDKGGLFVEPLISYSRDKAQLKTSALPFLTDTDGTMDSIGLGARLGFHVSEAVFIGVDGRFNRSSLDDSTYGSAKGNAYNIAPTIGVQMPDIGIRIFGSYVPWGTFDPEAGSNGFDVKMRNGKGFRVGAGFRVAAVSLNLEYQELKYDNTDVESYGGYTPPGGGVTGLDYETKGWIASVSFPLEL